MSDVICCELSRGGCASPFEIVMLGWQDGLTDGMAFCKHCGSTYHFEMVAWDTEQEVRIYGFRQVSRASYDAVATLHATALTLEHVSERADAVALKVRDALATSFERVLFVVASELAKNIIAVRRLGFKEWKALVFEVD